MRSKVLKRKKPFDIKLVKRQEMLTLTLQGWILSITLILALITIIITQVQPFLAVISPIKADILVVEGWLADEALKQALNEFEMGSYTHIITKVLRQVQLLVWEKSARHEIRNVLGIGAESGFNLLMEK